jgi:hypothetical protein
MTWLESLLVQTKPLEPYDHMALQEWLKTLRQDMRDFGPTRPDAKLCRAIRAKIREYEEHANG